MNLLKITDLYRGFVTFLRKDRAILRGNLLEYLIVAIVFLIIATIYMDFIPLTGLSHKIFAKGAGDATAGLVWANTVDNWSGVFASFTNMTNYPVGESLNNPYIITSLLLWLPVRFLSYILNPIAALNIATLSGFVLTAVSMYWLVKRLTMSIPVALFAGYALAFFPYATSKGSAHLAYIFNIFFVLILMLFLRLWQNPSRNNAILFALSIGICFYFDGYFALLVPVMVAVLCIAGIAYGVLQGKTWVYYLDRIKALLISLATLVLLLLPIIAYTATSLGSVSENLASSRSSITTEIPFYRSWVIDFLVPSKENPIVHSADLDAVQEYRSGRSDALSNTSYLGYINLFLAAFGLSVFAGWVIMRNNKRYIKYSTIPRMAIKDRRIFLLLSIIFTLGTIVFLAFMFSPQVTVLGFDIKLPGYWLMYFDIGLWRNLSRFSGPLQVLLVAYGSYVLWLICKYGVYHNKTKIIAKPIGMYALVICLMAILSVGYANTINAPAFDTSKPNRVYEWVRDNESVEVIAELPIVDPLDETASVYTTMQLMHQKKLINIKMPEHRVQANVLGGLENPETIDWMRSRGAQVALVHGMAKGCPQVDWGKIEFWDDATDTCVYKINNFRSTDDVYAVILAGADPTPNYTEGSKNTSRLNSNQVVLKLTDQRFREIDSVDCKARVKGILHNWNDAAPIEGTWRLFQANREVSSGHIGPVKSVVDAHVDCRGELSLHIERSNSGNDLLFENLDVDMIVRH